MKYGRLIYKYEGCTFADSNGIYSYGDPIQTFAVDNLYNKMGIPKDQIVDINALNMKNYDGEYVILPLCGYASHYKRFNQLPPSERIIPFIFSFEMSDEECDDIVPFLKKNQPIGCRDEATMILLRRKGIVSYLSGCTTVTFDKRNAQPRKNYTFFVDIPDKLKKFIPESLMIEGTYEYITHEGVLGHAPMTNDDQNKIECEAMELLKRYRDEASLVVTSRLHAAAPCIAMGIPVILAIDNIDGRFSFLDKLIPIYDEFDYNNIDWNPKSVEFENIKDKIFNIFKSNIERLYLNNKDIYDLSSYWENRVKVQYNRILSARLSGLRKRFSNDDNFKFIIWGAGVHGKKAYTMIKNEFPRAELILVVDKYMSGNMFGKPILQGDKLYGQEFDYAIVTTHPGRYEAIEMLEKMGKKKDVDYCLYISKSMEEEKNYI